MGWGNVPPVAIALAVILGLGAISLLPKLRGQTQTQVSSGQAAKVEIKNDDEQITVSFGSPTARQQFWMNRLPARASCDPSYCSVTKPASTQTIYFRWFNLAEQRWYHFQCPGNYRGTFQGTPM